MSLQRSKPKYDKAKPAPKMPDAKTESYYLIYITGADDMLGVFKGTRKEIEAHRAKYVIPEDDCIITDKILKHKGWEWK